MAEVLAELAQVTKRFDKAHPPALDAISATVLGGEITGLVGPDGAGKTTLIRLLTGLMVPDEGRIGVLGYDTRTQASGIHAAIGYMPQQFGLYEDLSVQENLNLYADLRGLPPAERPAVYDQLLTFTDLKPFTRRLAGKLSGGMKQKLGLACALLRKPRLLLLDEPAVGVDPISRRELWRMVEDLVREGTGVLWSTAYLDEAELCDRVLLLNQGRLLFDGPPRDMTGRAADRAIRLQDVPQQRRRLTELLSDDRVIDGAIVGQSIRLVTRQAMNDGEVDGLAAGVRWTRTEPRFEDAFIDMLGGGAGGRSRLAEAIPRIEGGNGPVISARGLTKRFGDFTAAQDISFEIPRGEVFGLLGPNGAGKSTTFKMLCGLLRPTAGEGRIAGFDLRRDTARARNRLGYMAQKFSLYGDLSAAQNLAFFAGVYGLSGARKRQQIELMTDVFELSRVLDQSAGALPLGFKQRLALACAVMHEPEALFLDEPTSGVDPITRREFWAHINGLVEKGVAILVTTHFLDEAEYCDRIALIHHGRSIALGPPDSLKARAATRETPNPTLEDAFVTLIREFDSRAEAA